MSNLLRAVTFDRANRKKDKSVSLTFITQTEQTSEEFMQMDSLLSDSGALFFKSNGNLSKEEIKALDGVEIENEGKTKSQRLRNVLFVYHKQLESTVDFKDFYATEVEKIIEHYKSKLD
tara:strand:+ start:44 stop:400 length:357 start_codon:yes stop_codon:yes gene_type:complete